MTSSIPLLMIGCWRKRANHHHSNASNARLNVCVGADACYSSFPSKARSLLILRAENVRPNMPFVLQKKRLTVLPKWFEEEREPTRTKIMRQNQNHNGSTRQPVKVWIGLGRSIGMNPFYPVRLKDLSKILYLTLILLGELKKNAKKREEKKLIVLSKKWRLIGVERQKAKQSRPKQQSRAGDGAPRVSERNRRERKRRRPPFFHPFFFFFLFFN